MSPYEDASQISIKLCPRPHSDVKLELFSKASIYITRDGVTNLHAAHM